MSSGSGQKTPASALLSRTPPRNRGSFAARPVASYSPRVVAEVKALACELPAKLGLPLSRFSRPELRRHVQGSLPTIPGNDGPALRAIRPCVVVRVLRVKIGHAAGVGTSLRPYHRLEVSCGVH